MTTLRNFIRLYRTDIYVGIFLCVICIILWFPVLRLGFFSDDYHFLYITEHQESVWKYFITNNVGEKSGGSYGPLWNVFFSFEYSLFGLQAVWYHSMTLLAYFSIALLIYMISKRLVHNRTVGTGAAVLFITLHNHVSSVSWVAVQPHVFASFFAVLGICLYMHFTDTRKWYWYAGSLLSFVVSIFIKETAIVFPAIIIMIELVICRNKISWKNFVSLSVYLLPFVASLGIFIFLRYHVVGYVVGYYGQTQLGLDIVAKMKMFIEISVNMFVASPWRQQVTTLIVQNIILFITMGTLFVFSIFVIGKKYWRQSVFIILCYILSTIPFLSLGFNAMHNGGERYSFFPSIFFVILLSQVIYILVEKSGIQNILAKRIIFLLVTVLFTAGSLVQVHTKFQDWSISASIRDTIFEDVRLSGISSNDYILFVALPDNVNGAEVFRNAIREAFYFETEAGYVRGERIMMFTESNKTRFNQQFLTLEKSDNSYIFLPTVYSDKRIFTGFPTVRSEFGDFILENFSRDLGHTGDQIVWNVNIQAVEDRTTENVKLILAYFDGLHMQFVHIQAK